MEHGREEETGGRRQELSPPTNTILGTPVLLHSHLCFYNILTLVPHNLPVQFLLFYSQKPNIYSHRYAGFQQ